ncbi:cobalamin biosynthesis protein CbiX [Aliiroseovarius sp.]|uniref:cobalamin biosynthesis protein CbiX n=1 Tax=Aliiroseovarius sp. TaxID=1872442 RepID=UPI00262006C0|nr:cobalamin biosynthesis protein CbiX [Aliiroseovarius sp.]
MNAHWPDGQLRAATMAAPGMLEAALDQLPPGAAIYPFFMARGWFVKSALARRLEGRDVRVLDPFGLDPDLPAVAAALIREEAAGRGWELADCHVLMAAHGSARGKAAAASAEDFATRLAPLLGGAGLRCGFVEQAPFLPDLAPGLRERTLCLPFFAMAGDHVRDDVTRGLRDAGFEGPILPALGQAEPVPALIAAALQRASANSASI